MGLLYLFNYRMQREPENAQHLYHFPSYPRAGFWLWEGRMGTSEFAPDLAEVLQICL